METECPQEARKELWGSSGLWRFLLVLINRPPGDAAAFGLIMSHVTSIISLHVGCISHYVLPVGDDVT